MVSTTNPLGVEATSIPYASPLDRLATMKGLIEEAPVEFQSSQHVPFAGALLGLALLEETHLMEEARHVYGQTQFGPIAEFTHELSTRVTDAVGGCICRALQRHETASGICLRATPLHLLSDSGRFDEWYVDLRNSFHHLAFDQMSRLQHRIKVLRPKFAFARLESVGPISDAMSYHGIEASLTHFTSMSSAMVALNGNERRECF